MCSFINLLMHSEIIDICVIEGFGLQDFNVEYFDIPIMFSCDFDKWKPRVFRIIRGPNSVHFNTFINLLTKS
jgi:hypothetical protein